MIHVPPVAEVKDYAILRAFRAAFEGRRFSHRDPRLSERMASQFFEDLAHFVASEKLRARMSAHTRAANLGTKTAGENSRRADGVFGEPAADCAAQSLAGFLVARGETSTIEIGVETKLLTKSLTKRIDRVIGDLVRQAGQFKSTGGNPITVGIVGVNFAPQYTSYERDREYPTDGKDNKHPIQEAVQAESRVASRAASAFDEFQFLRFRASNVAPYPFEWVDFAQTAKEYGALLVRISRLYDRRFP